MDIVSLTRNLFAGAVLFAVCAAEAAEQKPLLDYAAGLLSATHSRIRHGAQDSGSSSTTENTSR